MARGIFIPSAIQAKNIDALVRSAKCTTDDLENGSVVALNSGYATGEVFVAATPSTGNLSNLWIVGEPEVVLTDGRYKNIDPDVRNFYIPKGTVFTAVKAQVGDIVELSVDAVAGTKGANTFVVATNGAAKLTWAAAAISGDSLKLLSTSYISIADGSIGTQRTVSYKFEVTAIA